MFNIVKTRISQGYRTHKFPLKLPELSKRFKGLPKIDDTRCDLCKKCIESCSVNALFVSDKSVGIDIGKCIFCNNCKDACPNDAISFTDDFSLSANTKEDLLIFGNREFVKAKALEAERLGLFKKSFNLRVVSAGGCGACEADVNVLNTLNFDLSRFGIRYVASPRHADGILITGPVSKNMELAVRKTYDAIPKPKVVIAVGACAVSGGIYQDSTETLNGASDLLPVDLFIPGCPPNPYTILDGMLRLIGTIKQ
ncbi:MAG: NADH-quinone oxidoreductase subunit NuoB [Deltaproteobacteria bacterium]|nr:NADH-quinone oxidoreductase subunit NuoB [Deltaproteobacteria bacterium]